MERHPFSLLQKTVVFFVSIKCLLQKTDVLLVSIEGFGFLVGIEPAVIKTEIVEIVETKSSAGLTHRSADWIDAPQSD